MEKNINSKKDIKKIFGRNVKSARVSIGETQGDMRFATRNENEKKYNANVISFYENGKREPDMEQIKNLSEHLGITIDELFASDCSNGIFINYDWNNKELWIKAEKMMFPVFDIDDIGDDKYFKRAYKKHLELREKMDGVGYSRLNDDIARCIENYTKSFEENEKPETAANLLWWLFKIGVVLMMTERRFEGIKKINNQNVENEKTFYKDYWAKNYDDKNIFTEEEIKNTKIELEEEFFTYLRTLKKAGEESQDWSELAYYYSALSYLYKIQNNDKSEALNECIGNEIMDTLVRVGNKYAFDFCVARHLVKKREKK